MATSISSSTGVSSDGSVTGTIRGRLGEHVARISPQAVSSWHSELALMVDACMVTLIRRKRPRTVPMIKGMLVILTHKLDLDSTGNQMFRDKPGVEIQYLEIARSLRSEIEANFKMDSCLSDGTRELMRSKHMAVFSDQTPLCRHANSTQTASQKAKTLQ